MAASDASHLEALKTARDAITLGLASGASVVEYEIRGRRVRREPSASLLRDIEELIQLYESKTRVNRSRFKVVKLGPAKG